MRGQAPAPVRTGIGEDWVRAPITDADLRVRVVALRAKAQAYQLPQIYPCGVLRFGERFVKYPDSTAKVIPLRRRRSGHGVDI